MGGKTATSTQQVAVPPQVLAQYSSVNNLANSVATQPTTSYVTEPTYTTLPNGEQIPTGTQQVAQQGTELKPFQTYGGEFVAPVNPEQSSGIAGTNTYAQEAQPYYNAATGVLGSAQSATTPVNQAAESQTAGSSAPLTGSQIDQYLSPYLKDVVGSEAAVLNQNNQEQQSGELGNAITSGAFGGDRTGVAAANLEEQQNLSNAQIYSGLLNQGYNTALGTATTEQGIGLQGANQLAGIGQTAYGEGANTASELAGLGSGAQSAGLAGSQAQIAAGTVQQQTQQAQDTAQYNQFLQQQSYPFQVAQFLANIAEGTGALSGSTTTTQQPGGFFSDERLKEDMEPIGKTFDGQTIYRYKMKGDSRDRIGLSAQKVERKHPDAVGLAGGFRYVDYGKATEEAANRGHFYSGGVAGRAIGSRGTYAYGGSPDGGLDSVLQAQQNMYAPRGQQQLSIAGPSASHQLAVASGTPAPPPSGSNNVSQAVGLGQKGYQAYKWMTKPSTTPNNGVVGSPTNTAGAPAPSTTGTGVTTNFEGADQGTTTTFDAGLNSAPNSGLGAADTSTAAPAATDAAASGAADTAGAGAAETAGTGAAAEAGAGVAAGVGAEAGADTAAAIAAEYAAADVAAAAVMAAKRGGAVRRGYDAGGMPYSYPNDQLDIPDTQQPEHLQTAGALQKQPTGLQTAMKMGDPNEAQGMMGSMFSNTALASGGVAGRRGYDDGGTPTDDPDMPADTTPAIASDADRGAGIVGSTGGVWNSIKKHSIAENVIPILSGLAAMGTAPTRSAGVALAAGLGAGSQSYLNTRASLASTAEEQQKAKAAEIANRLASMKVQAAQNYLTPGSQTASTQPAAPTPYSTPTTAISPTAGAIAADKIDQQYRSQYFVPPVMADEAANMKRARGAAIALGSDQPVQDAQWQIDKRVAAQTAANRNAAQGEADRLYSIYMDPSSDPSTRQSSLAKYNALRQWTGDSTEIQGGIVKNKRTNLPEIGTIAQQGFTPTEDAALNERVYQLVDVPNSDGSTTKMPAFQAHHMTPDAYRQTLKGNFGASGAPPPAGGAAAPAPNVPAPVVSGTTQSPIALEQQKLNLAAVERAREAGDQTPNNRNINQQLLQLSPATWTGPVTQAVQKVAAVLGLPSGSRYQEINAYLDRQAASQALAMGVPHTNAGLAASQTATGTTEYTPQALQEKVKYADALNSGTMAYREGLDKAIGTGGTQNLQKYQPFRSAWARNFDPDIYRVEDAQRRGDGEELKAIRTRLGSRGMKALAQKSANLRLLENGQIPP